MARPPVAQLDDDLDKITISDFAGGLATAIGALSLGQNQFPSALNVIHLPGRLLFRGGWTIFSTIPGPADQSFAFKDSLGSWHYMVWAAGNLYDCKAGSAITIESNVYPTGQQIGVTTTNGILYWSTATPTAVPIRFYNPVAGTKGQLVGNLGPAGSVNPPAADFLFMYAGSMLAGSLFWGMPATGNVYQPVVFAWSNTNDVTTWIAANSQQVGSYNGGRLLYGRPFGIEAAGIPPTRNIIFLRNDEGVYAYEGALGTLTEKLLNCDAGCRDAASVQYCPTKGQFGNLVWFANDGQFWRCNGVDCLPISTEQILPTVASKFRQALSANTNPRFFSGYNHDWQYYWCNVFDTQFVWRWSTESWTLFQGWPVGPSFNAVDQNNQPAYFTAGNSPVQLNPFILGQSELGIGFPPSVLASSSGLQNTYVLAQIGRLGYADNGVMPSVYWASPILHAGDFDLFKRWHWAAIATLDTGVLYNVYARSVKRSNGHQQITRVIPMQAPNGSGNPFVLNQSVLGGNDVLEDPTTAALSPGTPVTMEGRLSVPIPVSKWWPAGNYSILEGSGMQLVVAYGGGPNAFDLLSAQVRFKPYGYRRGSGKLYNAEALFNQPFDPFYGYLSSAS